MRLCANLQIPDNIIIVIIIIILFWISIVIVVFNCRYIWLYSCHFYSNVTSLLVKKYIKLLFLLFLQCVLFFPRPFLFLNACITCLFLNYRLVCSLYPFLILNQIRRFSNFLLPDYNSAYIILHKKQLGQKKLAHCVL